VGKKLGELELFPSDVTIEPALICAAIGTVLESLGVRDAALMSRAAEMAVRAQSALDTFELQRKPFFCSGCPHNSSTKVPEGSRAMAGIGCHGMAAFVREDTKGLTHMGGEGATWYGAAKFSKRDHMFQNMGDGTYYHSGLMAIRGAVAADVNITYKILYNDATAMTGGQPMAGPLSVGQITRQLLAEGVKQVVVVTDRPELYGPESQLAPGVAVEHRDRLQGIQRKIREIAGVTAIVYEQTCAAEKRRRRKRREFADPPQRLFINQAVCEGCGDCSVQSSCMSLYPVETALGRKRMIDQSSCNKDYSCAKGFCPSFVTVHGGVPRQAVGKIGGTEPFSVLTAPEPLPFENQFNVMIAGIGGTGVVTIGAILAMASHIEGKWASVYDMTGMAQKGGAVYSHVKIAAHAAGLTSQRIGVAEADLLIGCDLIASVATEAIATLGKHGAFIVANSVLTPTSDFATNPDLELDLPMLEARLSRQTSSGTLLVDASTLSRELLGDTIGANLMLVGMALQRGRLPLSPASIEEAIRLNGTAIDFNLNAFRLGRLWVQDMQAVARLRGQTPPPAAFPTDAEDIVAQRRAFLSDYQDDRYAARYAALVERAISAERLLQGVSGFAAAVATNFAKLMAYKDEYEVARLYRSPEFLAQLEAQFEGITKLGFNLAPPLFARIDRETGKPCKREYGPWVFKAFGLLARMKGLRGTRLDPFGNTAERKMERAWIDRYEQLIDEVGAKLSLENHAIAVDLARVPDLIRGYGHVKEAGFLRAEKELQRLRELLENPAHQSGAVASIAPAGRRSAVESHPA
jgi:indolepyruvate ferredoxin oxidoreductase